MKIYFNLHISIQSNRRLRQPIIRRVGFCRGSRVEGRGSRVEGKKKMFFREVYIKIISYNRLRLIRCSLYGKQENSFNETVLY